MKSTTNQELFTEITSEEAASVNGGWFWLAVTGVATVYGVLPDAQKQKVNRAFSKFGQALFQPVKVY
ncbi:hypothetical protein [Nostoc sp.]|uniref:hypothetical protein n=1 Tax=Nostoc sp. TaxID=1180 RepID=UPI002FF7BAF8